MLKVPLIESARFISLTKMDANSYSYCENDVWYRLIFLCGNFYYVRVYYTK